MPSTPARRGPYNRRAQEASKDIGRKSPASSRTSYASGLSALTTDEPDAEEFARAVATEAAAIDAGFALLFFSQSLLDATVLSQALKTHAPALAYAAC